jgi:hypothetical protein
MRNYEILDLDRPRDRRTIADALAVLESQAAFGDDDTAEIRIALMSLAPRKCVGLVQVMFDVPCSDKSYAVPLPSAEYCYGSWTNGDRERYHIELLDRGTVDTRGDVWLTDGGTIHAVEIEPARLPLRPTFLDWRLVHVALDCCWTERAIPFSEREVHEKCYRPIGDAIRSEDAVIAHMVPDER